MRTASPLCPPSIRCLWLCFVAAIAGSCVHKNHVGPAQANAGGVPVGASMAVHRVYRAAFDAVEAALEVDDLIVAQATLGRLEGRLAIDQQSAPTMAEAKARQDEIAIRTLSGELPSAESVAAALRVADGFGKVIDGRSRMEAIDLRVALERRPGTEMVDLLLVAKSSWPEPLVLSPGLGGVEVLRASLEPRTGIERRESSIQVVEEGTRLKLPPGEEVRMTLLELPIEVPVGAIATRMEAFVYFNAGSVSDAGRVLPMRTEDLPRAKRTDLAGWVPGSLVEPSELSGLVGRGDAPLPAILERAVRIAPDRRDEALDRLGKVVQTLPIESFEAVVPAVRWIVGTNQFGRDEKRWRDWLIERYETRAAAGEAIGG